MDKWDNKNLDRYFVNKLTGIRTRFIARSDIPSVTLANGSHFCIGSLADNDWEIFKVKPEVVDKQDKIKELFNELDLEEQRSLVNEIEDCIKTEERKHCD